jgi:hypothetical protein
MSTPSGPPTGAELQKWAMTLQARIDRDPASAPVRYIARNLLETGWVLVASFLSPLLPKIPKGFSPDCLVLRLRTSVRDEPVQWPRKLLRLRGYVLEGRTEEMDPADPPLWTMTFLPPGEKMETGFLVDLIAIHEDTILVDPATGLPPRAFVPPQETPLLDDVARQTAWCRTAWAEVDRLGLSASIREVYPLASGLLRLPPNDEGLSPQVAQIVVLARFTATIPALAPLADVLERAPLLLRESIEHVQAQLTLEAKEAASASSPSTPA